MSYVLYARGPKPETGSRRLYVPIFPQAEEAKAWLDYFLEGEQPGRDGNKLLLEDGTTVDSEQLDRILSAPAGTLTEQDERRIARFRHGPDPEAPRIRAGEDDPGTSRPAKVERERRPERPPGYVTITELCASWNVLPMHARAALRASGREKPPFGWAFAPTEVEDIKKLVC